MSDIRKEIVNAALNRAHALIDYNIHNNIHKHYEFQKQTILSDESLTEDEKTEAIKEINKIYDRQKILYNSGTKRNCENCNQECLATLFCEYCVRNYLKANFPNWTSGNVDIDNLIQKCQLETITPDMIVEWIPYNNLQNIKYLTKGGCSEIYTADWIGGRYDEWDSKKKKLKRVERYTSIYVALKKLENVENANQRWLDEAKSNFTISSKHAEIVPCYGLTQDPSSGNYLLVMNKMTTDLRTYLQQLTWKERIKIINDITLALSRIHNENSIHRDLHSGNILYKRRDQRFEISDLGFCGPADKSLENIYGNLSYIAPEVIAGKKTTFASDIYSIGILMWEISSGQPPFINYEHNYYLAMNIINGIRPKIVSGTPLEYKNLMKQCWDADPLKRPSINTLDRKFREINLHNYQNESTESETNNNLELTKTNLETNYTSSRLFTSKVHRFENFPEPRNATEEEQEAFHNNSYKFYISDDDKELDDDEEYISKEHEFDISKEYKFDVNNIQSSSQNISSTIQNSSNTHQNTICTSMPSSKQRKRDIEESEIETQKDGKRVKILNSEFSD